MPMGVTGMLKHMPRLGPWAAIVPAVVAVGLLSGCVVEPAYGPGYHRGYYAPGYYYRDRDYYRERDDNYYRRW